MAITDDSARRASMIKTARNNKKLSQKDLGEILGISGTTVSGYELGTRTPNISMTKKLCDALDLEPREFI